MSIASRVVPGSSLTIARSLCTIELISEDLPTLGRPMIAMASGGLMSDSWCLMSPASAGAGRRGSISPNKSEIPRSCSALIATLGSKPNESKSAASGSCFSSSTLLITSRIDFRDLRSTRASSRSIGDKPSLASTTKSRRSLSRSASSAARRTFALSSAFPTPKIPPVSHTVNGHAPSVQVAEIRSRVIPG